ncbi:M4 family metallopeptidase [Luedemannella flava]
MRFPRNRRAALLTALVTTPLVVAATGSPALADAAASSPGVERANQQDGVSIDVRDNGRARHLAITPGSRVAAARPRGGSPESAARAHLATYGAAFGVRDQARELRAVVTVPQDGHELVRFQQTRAGLPVIGGELVVTLDTDGALLAINGETSADTAPVDAATVSAATAREHAIAATARAAGVAAATLQASEPTLSVYDPSLVGPATTRATETVWRLEVTSPTRPDISRYVLVNATDGHVALSFSRIATASEPNRQVCDLANAPTDDETCTDARKTRAEGEAPTGIADADNAYELTGAVHTFLNSLGRDGIDGKGMRLLSTTRFCPTGWEDENTGGCLFPNAFWNGQQMTFGDGFASADDVVGHELAHGVTEHTSGLLYYYQSGAINESISDVLGELFDLSYSGPVAGDDSAEVRWLLGEDLPRDPGAKTPTWVRGAIRSMKDPTLFGDPDSTQSDNWKPAFDDNGGVHADSGVGNKAAYLMTDGGTFGGVTVAGIRDVTKVAKIWLGAEKLLTSGADYADLAYALQQSCANLGYTTECASVSRATAAVQMTRQPATEAAPAQAAICPAGTRPRNLFVDRFSSASAWNVTSTVAVDGSVRPSAVAGNALLMQTPFIDRRPTITATLRSSVTLPTSGTVYVRFDHLDAFDWIGPGYLWTGYFDGGFLGITTSTATNPTYAAPKGAWVNGPNREIEAAYGGIGFGGDSRGWTSSRITLDPTTYRGKKVKLQFKVRTDGIIAGSAAYGWWLDNVQVYTCAASSPVHSDYNGDGVNDVAIGSPDRDVDGLPDAGAVTVSYGSSGSGLTTSSARVLTAGVPVANQQFGAATTSADFNGDGFADLAVGAAAKGTTAGRVTVYYGSSEGLTALRSKAFASTTFTTSAAAGFGKVLAAGDVNKDGRADLAIGTEGFSSSAGGVGVLKGTSSGLTTTGRAWLTQNTTGVPDAAEAGDRFGAALAIGDLNRDGYADLAVGAPGETVGSPRGGMVTVLRGSATGVTGTGARAFTQNTTGVPDGAETGDLFGAALAIGDLNRDGYGDLAVGAPGESVGTRARAGIVTVLKGSTSGVTGTGAKAFSQNTTGVPDSAETGDQFGAALAVGDVTGDGYHDLAVGVPGESAGSATSGGVVTVLKGSTSGVTGTGAVVLGQSAATGGAEAGDQFGAAVAIRKIRSGTQANVLVGIPGEDAGKGAVVLFPGGPTTTGAQVVTNGQFAGGAQAGTRFGGAIG